MIAIWGVRSLVIPDRLKISLTLIDPAYNDETKVKGPSGAMPIVALKVVCDL